MKPTSPQLDVIVVGAGLSGIAAGYYLKTKTPWANFKIYESRSSLGGTWDLFQYPGIRSDSDMYTLGFSFNPWKSKQSIADGPNILNYLKSTASKYKIEDYISFNHKVIEANWSSQDNYWTVLVQNDVDPTGDSSSSARTFEITCKFLFFCSGYYNYDHGYLPEFKNIENFKNTIIHPQFWPEDLNYDDKDIVIIGSGATAVTLIPSLAKKANKVTMLQRSPTYIVTLPKEDPIANFIDRMLPDKISGPIVRWLKALTSQASYRLSKIFPKQMASMIKWQVKAQLPKDFDVDKHFTPKYNPWDQRLCVVPDGDLFKAIRHKKADVVTDQIEYFTEDGIMLSSENELKADIVITATGLDLVFLGNVKVTVDAEPLIFRDHITYRGMMLDSVPNLAWSIGYTNASWTLKAELICDFTTRMLNKMHNLDKWVVYPSTRNGSVFQEPLMGLSSGYILRSLATFPQQGSKYPWKVYQSYLKDFILTKLPNAINDDSLVFSDTFDAKNTKISS